MENPLMIDYLPRKPSRKSVRKTATRKPTRKSVRKTASRKPTRKSVRKTAPKKPSRKSVRKIAHKKPSRKSVRKIAPKKPTKESVTFLINKPIEPVIIQKPIQNLMQPVINKPIEPVIIQPVINKPIEPVIIQPVIKKESKYKYEKGFIVNNHVIESISGPVYMSVLKPKLTFYKQMKAPIFILFGDIHTKITNTCVQCSCSIDKSCCYSVYSKDFLKLIDDISKDPKYPTDFYLEAALTWYDKYSTMDKQFYTEIIGYDMADPDVMFYLIEKIRACYNRQLKNKNKTLYKELCPTEYIRWQLADIRQLDIKDTTYIYDNFLFNFKSLFTLYQTGSDVQDDKLIKILKYISSIPKNKEYLDTLKHITEQNYYDYIDKPTTLIFKQILKMPLNEQKQWDIWCKKYYDYMYTTLKSTLKTDFDTMKKYIIELINLIKEYIVNNDINKIKSFLEKIDLSIAYDISNFIMDISIISLDLYFLSRSFKKPLDSEKPLISIGYFGRRHCVNIHHFLMNIVDEYEDVFTENNPRDDKIDYRCIKINKNVNLDDIIKDYKIINNY